MIKDFDTEIKKFKKDIIEGYNKSRDINEVISDYEVRETKGDFTQIAIRTLIDIKWFTEDNYANFFDFLSKPISLGEFNYFVKQVIDLVKKNAPPNYIESKKIDLGIFKREFRNVFGRAWKGMSIITSIDFLYDIMLKNEKDWGVEWNSNLRRFAIQGIPIYTVQKEIIGNHIIFVDKNSGTWLYKKFKNFEDSDEEDIINIKILDSLKQGFKLDVVIRTLIKLEIFDYSNISILKMGD